ncbi:MAG: RNA polymerase-binding protein DksA [Deltaproteobacteria bacterium]|nr:RNA polymerase-binding protein DksA [Candidatus Dadabacteria bacterium]TDI97391.1 MAG: RNA polymerase-binding protein DksA [Deltaproteobacteria bacterium]TDJ08088.1 MAG: RNA polymerase-binding protein DksA [Deltaproteobacteria bacterium]
MKAKELKLYKDLLLQRVDNLVGSAGETLDTMSKGDDSFPDPIDRAMSESNRSIELRKRDRERKLIQKIKKAIQRTEDGSYGVCDECGEEISESRLKARPETILCINCKEEQEKVEKQFGL